MALANLIKSVFGSKAERDYKAVKPILDKVLASYETIDKLSDDELRAHSARLRQHMIDVEAPFENRIAEIKAKLDELRGGLQADGGDCELVKIDGKVVYLRLVGHCGSCPFAMMTLKQGIETALQEIDPEITVERVTD